MRKGIAITGMGIISSIGNNLEETYSSLSSGNNGLSFSEILQTTHTNLPVGEIKRTNLELQRSLNITISEPITRASLLGIIAVKEAISHAKFNLKDLNSCDFISGTSVGGIDATERFYSDFENGGHTQFIKAQHPGYTTCQIAKYFKINGQVSTISTACSSAANAIMLGARLINSGRSKRVIVGGTDCLTKFTLNGFNSLMILSDAPCKPFDEERNGLNLGEGAAYLILEADNCLDGKKVLGRVTGYANTNDSYHQTASSPEGDGAYLAMKNAINFAEIDLGEIDFIHAHGTATKNNDLSESAAMKRIFKNHIPDFASTKGFTGHTLAAAGAVQAVLNLLMLENQQIFPNLNFEKSIYETELSPVTKIKDRKIKNILSNSFGFGGNCTSLIFSKDEK
ncbi:3-oxoacyl-[acyl-carrier-protein] synthase-1 [Gillisia sp. Hel1_33_143]|uniref:beta-ketoacyl-[acyl-carrier-protein] synthase family protein n=1 Tax=unclassified Gillisia TaxID=2615025 RepID=UPI000551507C|nr:MULTISPECIES: beta-ketoacyl-[acyl-carrier-protein] synthase family protein [unclassified Gillisia]SDS55913.1 3-oxoacyl-[acyl-carrier-protein] synthase-1 [Gillisia sp. Hel1_33_143]